jgi:hypothetical protein
MGKYEKHVNDLRLWTELVRLSCRGRMADFSIFFGRKVFPEAKIRVENFHVFAPGAGVMIPGEMPMLMENEPVPPGTGQHAHPDFDELLLFFGSNPHDTLNLGGEWSSGPVTRKDTERFRVTKASSEYVPAGLVHNPHYFRSVERPFVIAVISLTPSYDPAGFRYTPLPDGLGTFAEGPRPGWFAAASHFCTFRIFPIRVF